MWAAVRRGRLLANLRTGGTSRTSAGREISPPTKSAPRISVADPLEHLRGLMKALRVYHWIQIGVTDMPRTPERP
jgi:hypothetical protein